MESMRVNMRKKLSLILWVSLSILALSFRPLTAQVRKGDDFPFGVSKIGLEVPDYKKVLLLVEFSEYVDEDTSKIGLTEEKIRSVCESRLKQAGLEPLSGFSRSEYLYINISVRYKAYYILLQFNRPVTYKADKTEYLKFGAKTWQKIALRHHQYNPENIIQVLNELLEDFLNDYLQANSK
jgi:hypothetical protein